MSSNPKHNRIIKLIALVLFANLVLVNFAAAQDSIPNIPSTPGPPPTLPGTPVPVPTPPAPPPPSTPNAGILITPADLTAANASVDACLDIG